MSVNILVALKDKDENRSFANTMTFISCRGRLTTILAGATRGEKGSLGGEAE